MMGYGMMGGWGGAFGTLGFLTWLVWMVVGVELAVFLWKKIKS